MAARPMDNVGSTCNVTLKKITKSFNNSPQPRLDELDYTTKLVVLLSFNNYEKVEHHACDNDYLCKYTPGCYKIRNKLTVKSDERKLVFLVDPKTLYFDVLTAATNDRLPDYVTPGVWKAVKYGMFLAILDKVNYTEKKNPMIKYEMRINVDVTTYHLKITGVGDYEQRAKSLRKPLVNKISTWMMMIIKTSILEIVRKWDQSSKDRFNSLIDYLVS